MKTSLNDGRTPKLEAEVTKQLLDDLSHYGYPDAALSLDWSDKCIEGSADLYLDGEVHNWSSIGIQQNGDEIGGGWMEFCYDGEDTPLVVYWEFLVMEGTTIKDEPGIPPHIWDALPGPYKKMYKSYKLP